MSAPLLMAVIGCGPIGELHAQAIAKSPYAKLIAACDLDAARRADLAARFGAAAYANSYELFAREKLDAVTVATPDHLHCEPALAAIAAGCHVFCEKPLAANVGEALRMVRAADDRGVHLAVDYNRRFALGYRQAYDWLVEHQIGQLESTIVRVTDPVPPAKVARNPYAMLTTLLTHHFDLVRWYGGDILRLRARTGGAAGRELVRDINLSIELTSGAQATIAAQYRDNQARTSEWMALHGSSGAIVVENIAQRVILSGTSPELRVASAPPPAGDDPIRDSIIAHVQSFVEHIAAERTPLVTGRDGLIGMKLASAAIESLTMDKAIEMESP